MTTSRRTALIDSLTIAVLVSILIWPLFRLVYLDNWSSIESTFIGDVRMIGEHFPHFSWQPLWYCGTRADYVYPPALRYGTALLAWLGHLPPVRAYHLFTAVFYVAGILSVYWMVRIGSKSRGAALLASSAAALLSPSFLVLPAVRQDSAWLVPQRLHTLMNWGEGPHISALAVLPFALAAVFAALRSRNRLALAAAGALCALVVAINFYGATSLAILYPILVWSVWLCDRPPGLWLRAAAIPLLAWGLSAFWLTPSYIRITNEDLKLVSLPGTTSSGVIFAIGIALFVLFSFRTSNRRPEHLWTVFVCGTAIAFSVWVLGFYALDLRVTGDPVRLIAELDLALILLFVEIFRRLWQNPALRIPVALLTLAPFYPAMSYIGHAWSPFPRAGNIENVYEYRVAAWVNSHLPGARVLSTGTVRFWFDVWFNNGQPDGGSFQSVLNPNVPVALWRIVHEDPADRATLWLQALGTDALIVPGPKSPEPYRDYVHPEEFRGALPVLTDEFPDTAIYSVPRVHPGIVRIVDRAAIHQITGGIDDLYNADNLRKYVSVIEDPAQPSAILTWHGTDEFAVDATISPAQSILVQESWDRAWHADENGKSLPVQRDSSTGFMLIDAPEGAHHIRVRFQTPRENRFGQVVFALTAILIIAFVIRRPSSS